MSSRTAIRALISGDTLFLFSTIRLLFASTMFFGYVSLNAFAEAQRKPTDDVQSDNDVLLEIKIESSRTLAGVGSGLGVC